MHPHLCREALQRQFDGREISLYGRKAVAIVTWRGMDRSIGFHQNECLMPTSPAQNQEPSPRSGPDRDRGSQLLAHFSQATAEGEQALALQGRPRSNEGLVHYRTTSW